MDVPVRSILGVSDGPDRYFDLICWNEASAPAEANNTPYFAAGGVTSVAIFRPAGAFGLLEPLSEPRTRYEPWEATGAEISAVLDDFRAGAPWPITPDPGPHRPT